MDSISSFLLINAAGASLLMLAAWMIGRVVARPEWPNTAWLVVLFEFIVPPLVVLPIVPVLARHQAIQIPTTTNPPRLATEASAIDIPTDDIAVSQIPEPPIFENTDPPINALAAAPTFSLSW